MSFSDLMSSSRGPGVIGMVMALIVLLGFGGLFMFAEPNAQGSGPNILSVIRHQATEIDSAAGRISEAKKLLEKAESRRGLTTDLASSKAMLVNASAGVEAGKAKITDLNQGILNKAKELEDYKNAYRQKVRAEGKGESIPEIQTLDGTIYKKVVVREVTAVGIQIAHEDGIKRIPFEMLPAAIQERFQYDASQKEEALKNEALVRNRHEAAVETMNQDLQAQAEARKEAGKEASRKAAEQEYQTKSQLLSVKNNEVKAFERAIAAEKRKSLSRAPAMEAQLVIKQQELEALRLRVEQLRTALH